MRRGAQPKNKMKMTLTLSEKTAIVAMSALSAIKDIAYSDPTYRSMISDALTEFLRETAHEIAKQHAIDEICQSPEDCTGQYGDSDYFPTEDL